LAPPVTSAARGMLWEIGRGDGTAGS
jgi:hypothetical protein